MPILKAGAKAPKIELEDENGKKISLKDFSGKKIILYFYPKDMTTGCTQEACDFRDAAAKFKKKGAIVLGVSKDSIASHQKFIAKHDLNFTLLSDPDTKASEAFGVWKEKSLYGRKYMGIERSTFIIGKDGKIEKIYAKVKVKGHVEQVLADL